MKFFIDTEFIETKTDLQLISIAIVREDGKGIYKHSSEYNRGAVEADPWLKENVVPHLKGLHPILLKKIKQKVAKFIRESGGKPEFYAYCGATDWVLFYRLWGRLMDLPDWYPWSYMDLLQMLKERNLSKEWVEENCPKPDNCHDALADARWNMELLKKIEEYDKTKS